MERRKLGRREFVKSAVGTGVALGVGGQAAPAGARVQGANDRINIGVIGVGGRGRYLLRWVMETGGQIEPPPPLFGRSSPETKKADPRAKDVRFYYRYQNGHPAISMVEASGNGKARVPSKLAQAGRVARRFRDSLSQPHVRKGTRPAHGGSDQAGGRRGRGSPARHKNGKITANQSLTYAEPRIESSPLFRGSCSYGSLADRGRREGVFPVPGFEARKVGREA